MSFPLHAAIVLLPRTRQLQAKCRTEVHASSMTLHGGILDANNTASRKIVVLRELAVDGL
jgi:hypothetical protein